MNFLDDVTRNYLNLAADIIEVLVFLIVTVGGTFYSIFRKKRDTIPFWLSTVLAYALKASFILFGSVFIIALAIEILKATTFITNEPILISIAIASLIITLLASFIWIFGSFVWTGSLNNASVFFKLLGFKVIRMDRLEILEAKYGILERYIDITNVLNRAIVNDILDVTASNNIAGDPYPGIQKELVVRYRKGSVVRSATVREGERCRIPLEF